MGGSNSRTDLTMPLISNQAHYHSVNLPKNKKPPSVAWPPMGMRFDYSTSYNKPTGVQGTRL